MRAGRARAKTDRAKTDHWDVAVPGFTELDLVDGEFVHSLNVTDIHSPGRVAE